jgi:alkanesulfonate monooxygenase SsuD/methylene tetrahydromethanopterin reductase-like flavin-dependent oxidoreductase (luciferase family)
VRVGIGLPTAVAGADPSLVVGWARRADAGPFASVGVHDRLVYDSVEPLVALGAAAAVTERVDLACLVAIAPLRPAALLAKQARSIDALSGGRLVLGLGVGPREDDYRVAGVEYARRGGIFERQLVDLRSLWRRPDLGPWAERSRPRLLLGGGSDAALLRLARYADGYVHNGGPARAFRTAAHRVVSAWADSGRPGRPELWGLGYFALGPGAKEEGWQGLLDYYAFTGGFASRIAAGLLVSPEAVRALVREYAEAGCDHLVLFPTVARLDQVDRLADANG